MGRLDEGGLKALFDLASLPVIFTSRLGERALDRHEGLRQRGVFLAKPVEPDVLRKAISLVIAQSGPFRDADLEASG